MSKIEPYLKCSFEVVPKEPWIDLLIADLGSIGFEAFENTEKGFDAYLQKKQFNSKNVQATLQSYANDCQVVYETTEIEPVNWNEKWEQEFEPVMVDDQCIIKAPFHELDQAYTYTITLNPKMAFGTGHHQTTFLMVRDMLNIDMKNKSVLDMGSGTGVLAILATLKGASSVRAIDIDDWAYENCLENISINDTKQIIVEKGNVSRLEGLSFNIILANINKNVLMEDIKQYASCLESGGYLLLSGFFEEDIPDIVNEASKYSLKKDNVDALRKWAQVRFVKSE